MNSTSSQSSHPTLNKIRELTDYLNQVNQEVKSYVVWREEYVLNLKVEYPDWNPLMLTFNKAKGMFSKFKQMQEEIDRFCTMREKQLEEVNEGYDAVDLTLQTLTGFNMAEISIGAVRKRIEPECSQLVHLTQERVDQIREIQALFKQAVGWITDAKLKCQQFFNAFHEMDQKILGVNQDGSFSGPIRPIGLNAESALESEKVAEKLLENFFHSSRDAMMKFTEISSLKARSEGEVGAMMNRLKLYANMCSAKGLALREYMNPILELFPIARTEALHEFIIQLSTAQELMPKTDEGSGFSLYNLKPWLASSIHGWICWVWGLSVAPPEPINEGENVHLEYDNISSGPWNLLWGDGSKTFGTMQLGVGDEILLLRFNLSNPFPIEQNSLYELLLYLSLEVIVGRLSPQDCIEKVETLRETVLENRAGDRVDLVNVAAKQHFLQLESICRDEAKEVREIQ